MVKKLSRINQGARARKRVQAQITRETSGRTGMDAVYAKGFAGEGYKGGYRDALDDVILLLNGAIPYRNFWWEDDD